MQPKVELIYDTDCPNVDLARSVLQQAFAHAKIEASWTEIDRQDPSAPNYAHAFGSPTILVNGQDVARMDTANSASCCRVYQGEAGFRKAPDVGLVVAALRSTADNTSVYRRTGFQWRKFLAAVPGIAAVVIPVGHCPACWPAYAGVLSALGMGFLFNATYMIPIMTVLLLIALASLGYRACSRHGYKPFGLGLASTIVIVVGKFVLASDPVVYFGLTLLVVASIWNAWPRKEALCER